MVKVNRLPGLDGLRAISALLIVLAHACYQKNISESVSKLLGYGSFGVDIFFVISGFIITYIILREEERTGYFNIKQFYIRRALRILPPAYFYLFVICIVTLFGLIKLTSKEIISAVFFFRNLSTSDSSVYTGHYWSLSIEEQFYIIWPAIVFFLPKNWRLTFCVIFCAIAPVWRQLQIGIYGAANINWWRADLRYDSLLTGVLLALLWQYPYIQNQIAKQMHHSNWIVLGLLIAIIFSYWIGEVFWSGINFFLIPFRSWCVAGILITLIVAPQHLIVSRIFNYSLLVWIGKASYSLYLWQQLATHYLFIKGWIGVIFAVSLSFIFTAISYYGVEYPMLKLRANLDKSILNKHKQEILI